MAPFMHTIKGRIVSLDGNKKEISLLVKDNLGEAVVQKKLDFNLDSHVRITNGSEQSMGLSALKINQNVEVGYFSNKSKMTA
ncbi:MAG: hypothetical protein CO035_01495, partial [Candidatus Omnitrophica bacterium CG_4_9_14_0_2_um_filter_42_8]